MMVCIFLWLVIRLWLMFFWWCGWIVVVWCVELCVLMMRVLRGCFYLCWFCVVVGLVV